jgi:hypothetical protein
MRPQIFVCAIFAASCLAGADFPQAEISNGVVTAKFYLPDAESGYYRGTRFDWSGVIYSLQTLGHEYFGQWFERYDPKLHDAIQGPVEEFRSADGGTGYADAAGGGTFVRIGVGTVRKPEGEKEYQLFKTYEIVDPGKWTIRKERDSIEFVHELRGPNGYAYRYSKKVRLVKGKPEMVLEHALKNTGSRAIRTEQYDHNFFMFDSQPTGPDASVRFPFNLKLKSPLRGTAAEVKGGMISFTRELRQGESVFGEFEGFGAGASDYDIRMEHRKARAGVHIIGDQPLSRQVFWSIRTTFCPEPYIAINVEPGRTFRWKYTYEFYSLPEGSGTN